MSVVGHASHPVSPVRTARRIPHSRPPPVPGTHAMALHPSSVPLPAPPVSSLPEVPDPESDRARAASPTVARLLATAVTDTSFEFVAASALVAELLDFAAACRLDYATALVAESASASPPSVGGECALGTDILEDRQEEFECLAAAVPRFASMLLAPEGDSDAPDIPTPRSYAEAITGPYSSQWQAAMDSGMAPTIAFMQGSLHEEIWLRRPSGFTGTFPAGTQWSLRRPVYGLRQAPREWHDTLRTTLAALGFAPSTANPSLFLRTDTSLPPFYVLVYVDYLVFTTADTEALILLKSELQKRHTCTDLGELCSYLGLQITRDRARRTITLTQSHMVHQVLQCFGFQFSSPQPTPLNTSHSLSAPPLEESVEPSGPYPELVGCLMYLMTCTRPDLAYPLSLLARYVAPGRHRKVHRDVAKRVLRYLCSTLGMGLVLGGQGPGYTFSLGSGSVSWRSTRSSSVLSSSCEAEIYAGAMAAQELRWLTYLLTDLGEQPRSPAVLTKHIALRYFLARELQQRGQLRLAYVATRANTADVFTKALPPGDHQRFATVLGLLALFFLTGLVTTCSPPLCLWGSILCRTAPLGPTTILDLPEPPELPVLPCPNSVPHAALPAWPHVICPPRRAARLLPGARPARCPAHVLPCPALQPARRPALQPARRPALQLARRPTLQPARRPALQRSRHPALQPARRPALQPTRIPALQPTRIPALQPVRRLALQPARRPALQPAHRPACALP
ncbi:unnamed protein product [Closterium sp. NIES-53]